MSKLLGIDYGQKKVGLAFADTDTKTAVPLTVVSLDNLISKIQELIKTEGIEKIIVGLPLGMNGRVTEQTKKVKKFIKDLESKINLEVVAEDERLSTVQAQKSARPLAKPGKDDARAAMYILQSYLDNTYG